MRLSSSLSRLAFGAIGYDYKNFAQHAKIIVIDNDGNEIIKNKKLFEKRIIQSNQDVASFIKNTKINLKNVQEDWLIKCS